MNRTNLTAVVEQILGLSSVNSDKELSLLIQAVKSNPKIRDMKLSELADIAKGIQAKAAGSAEPTGTSADEPNPQP